MNKQFLSFSLQNNLYAVEVSRVQEVLEYCAPVKLPCTASHVEGIINSRGEGITAISLRSRFSLECIEPDKKTRIIVLEIKRGTDDTDSGVTIFGAIADSVEEVIELDDSNIETAPKFGNSISEEFISGIARKDEKFIIILNVDKIFGAEAQE